MLSCSHKETSKSVMAKVSNQSMGALQKSTFMEWRDLTKQSLEDHRLGRELDLHGGKLKAFAKHNKGGAKGVHKRAAELLDLENLIFFFVFWKREIKIGLMMRYGAKKVNDQKESLIKVKRAVGNFAGDLEGTLRQGTPPGSSR